MNTFVNAMNAPVEARTTNGMKALDKTGSRCVDLFSAIGASRGKNVIPMFTAAFAENPDIALRIALWARDVRGGAGERQVFRDILEYLEKASPKDARRLMARTADVGRWDDLLVLKNGELFEAAVRMIKAALDSGNGLCAKWMPRKGEVAVRLRTALGMTPKQYRKTLVNLTNVVETKMCANDWENIELQKLPSLASSRYKKAFVKHIPDSFQQFTTAAAAGEVKINAGAVFPYDVLKGRISHYSYQSFTSSENDHVRAQWNALPNYMGDGLVLPVVDVSGSMSCSAGGQGGVTSCLDVAVSLGLYCADKSRGPFKDVFVTFSSEPEFQLLKGDIISKIGQMASSSWNMSTNLNKVFEKLLSTSVKHKVKAEDMPRMILIMSDMQFNQCTTYDDSAIEMIKRKYVAAGYEVPQVVFWNLNDHGNKPVESHATGVALVSGFSPAILKSVLAADLSNFTPEGIMLSTVMVDRYNV